MNWKLWNPFVPLSQWFLFFLVTKKDLLGKKKGLPTVCSHGKSHAYSKSVVLEVLSTEGLHQKLWQCLFKDIPGSHPNLLNQNFRKQGPGICTLTECPGDSYARWSLKINAFDSRTLFQRYGLNASGKFLKEQIVECSITFSLQTLLSAHRVPVFRNHHLQKAVLHHHVVLTRAKEI